MSRRKPSIAVLYHFFPPDDIVSAVHYGDLCSGLASRGWQVGVYPCIWSSQESSVRFPAREEWQGVTVKRIWRPNLRQASDAGRFLNAAWMIFRWSLLSLTLKPHPDVLLVGTDPILSLSVASVWKLFSPRTKIVHWCYDAYPEAAVADGLLPPRGLLTRFFAFLMGSAYRKCALIADLGPCMRALLMRYPSPARRETIVPWAFEEPDKPLPLAISERLGVFGDVPLALLYSGSFGRAHSSQEILDLTELLHPYGAKLVFSVRGKRQEELRKEVNLRGAGVEFVPFASPDKLQDRLACADIHVVTLRPGWAGMVVPSKFFGALAAGRPVLFAGSVQSSLALWIREFQIGWVLTGENVNQVKEELLSYMNSPEQIDAMQRRCFRVYRERFLRDAQINKFDRLLRLLVNGDSLGEAPQWPSGEPRLAVEEPLVLALGVDCQPPTDAMGG
jgi:colanic acid biosynthesis glycosyl transferase WcaI